MTPITIPVATVVNVPWDVVTNALVGCLEMGASSEWLQSFRPSPAALTDEAIAARSAEEGPWYAKTSFWIQNNEATATFDAGKGDDEDATATVNSIGIQLGLTRMAAGSPRHFTDLVDGNDDAITHDVLMQYILLADVVYG